MAANRPDAFVHGATLPHIVSTSLMGAAGLMTLFAVDLADLYFLSLLGETALAAAVGYAGTILFFTTSICIGFAIAMTALVARAVGANELNRAQRYVGHGGLLCVIMTTPIAALLWYYVPELVSAVGATGRAHELAVIYLRVIIPAMPVLALAMSAGGVLRATGAAKLAMYSTIAGGLANAILDPIFIFTLEMGVAGAATASVAARFVVLGVAAYGVIRTSQMLGRLRPGAMLRDAQRMLGTALPAIATNLATPVSNLVVMRSLAVYGDEVIAGYAIIGRLTPVAFGIVFALSGAIGPIVGQNFGAGKFGRVQRALLEAAAFATLVVVLTTLIMALLLPWIIQAFDASAGAADLIQFFVYFVAVLFIFAGLQFISNAAFNNLGKPLWSTATNWGRATLGTFPFVWLGGTIGGASGILLGHALGGVLFGLAAFIVARRLVAQMAEDASEPASGPIWRRLFATPLSPQSNIFGWIPAVTAQRFKRPNRHDEQPHERS